MLAATCTSGLLHFFLGGGGLDNSVQVLFFVFNPGPMVSSEYSFSDVTVKVHSLTLGDKFNPKNIWGCKHAPGLTFHLLSFGLETVDENPE